MAFYPNGNSNVEMGETENIFFSPTLDQIWQRLLAQPYEAPVPCGFLSYSVITKSTGISASLPGRTENLGGLQAFWIGLTTTVQNMYLSRYPIFNRLDSNSG